jgi:hypothetical protein
MQKSIYGAFIAMIKKEDIVDEDGDDITCYYVDDEEYETLLRQMWKTQNDDDYCKVAHWLNKNIENAFDGIKTVTCERTQITLLASRFKNNLK